jgi:hypothetical protein
MRIALPSFVMLTTALGGCAITQNIAPVERLESRQVCIVENPAVVQEGFLVAFRRALQDKGYAVQMLPPGSALTSCPIASTYTANWRWDLALYMAFADIRVFKNGQQSGHAIYDSTGGSLTTAKFIKGDEKITELVNKLFPNAP